MKRAQQVIQDAKTEPTKSEIDAAEEYYVSNVGDMETASESQFAEKTLEHLAANFASPVVSVEQESGDVYYGVLDYAEGDEWYGFFAWDEHSVGNRVIGAREADTATIDSDLQHVSAGDSTGSFADQPDATFDELATRLGEHYDDAYGEDRSSVTVERPTHTVPSTRGKPSGPNMERARGRDRAKGRAPGHSNAGGN